jgi:hypothetical protein
MPNETIHCCGTHGWRGNAGAWRTIWRRTATTAVAFLLGVCFAGSFSGKHLCTSSSSDALSLRFLRRPLQQCLSRRILGERQGATNAAHHLHLPPNDDADRTAHHPHVERSTHRGSAHRRRVNNTPALTSIHGGAGRVSFLTNDGTVLRMFDEPSWRSGGLNESDDDGAAQADGSRAANRHDTVGRGSARPMDMSSTDFSLWAAAPTAKERPPLQPVGRGGVTRRDVDSRSYVGTTKRAEQQWARELTTLYRELRSFRHQHSTGRYCETLLSMAGACTQLASAVASGSVAS